MSNFAIYMIGILILIGGLFYAASVFNWPQTYVIIGALVLLGIGVLAGVSRTRRPEPPGGPGGPGGPPPRV